MPSQLTKETSEKLLRLVQDDICSIDNECLLAADLDKGFGQELLLDEHFLNEVGYHGWSVREM